MEQRKEPIRILHIVGRMDRGGIETMLMNLYRNIDRDKVQFDFLAHYGREAAYNDEIRAMGGRIYEMPALKTDEKVYYWKLFQYISALHRFFREHREYKIIHGHMTNTASIYMPIAKKYGVTCRIAHSHNTHGKAGFLGYVTNLLQKPIYKYATDWFACSKAAANWFYPKKDVAAGKVKVVPNAVDAQKFRYNEAVRRQTREQLGIADKLVIGCVARFRPEKNQIFLLQVLQEVLKTRPNAMLLFVGDGPCEQEVLQKAQELGIGQKVRSLGQRSDVPELMQAMDVFVLPSLWEGLPVVGVEAQASGLRCVVSDGVTTEMNAIDMVEFISLQETLSHWAQAVITAAERPREDTFERIRAAGFDIHTTVPWLQAFYINHST